MVSRQMIATVGVQVTSRAK